MNEVKEGSIESDICYFRRCSSRNTSGSKYHHQHHHSSDIHQHLENSNADGKHMEAVLTLDDIEELTRRRDQLRTDVDTSLLRIAEIQAWVANTTTTKTTTATTTTTSIDSNGGKPHYYNIDINNNNTRNSSSSESHPHDLSAGVSTDAVSAARANLRAARAAVSAVPLSEWRSLRRLRPLPLAAAAVLDAASSLLGENLLLPSSSSSRQSQQSQQSQKQQSTSSSLSVMRKGVGWRLRLLRREPGDVAAAAVHAVRRRRFVAAWPYDRVRPVHPALGPLHRWITAMLDTREAEREADNHSHSNNNNTNNSNSDNTNNNGAARVGSETAALMLELEEHAEYVQMAKDELAAIDALLTDAVREAEKCAVGVSTNCPSPTVCSETAAPSSEASWSLQTEWGETTPVATGGAATKTTTTTMSITGRTITSTGATGTGTPRIHLQQKQKQRQKIKEKEQKQTPRRPEPPSTASTSTSTIRHTTMTANEKGEAAMTVVVPPIVPKLALQKCLPQRNETAAHSLQARLEQLRKSPRMRSPRLGRAILPSGAHFTSSAAAGGAHNQHSQDNCDTNSNTNAGGDAHMLYTSAEVLQERADLLQRVHELEDRLKEAYQRNPREAEFQLMRDEMNAARDELASLRAERNQLLEQNKRYSLYKLPTTMDVDTAVATASVPTSISAANTTTATTNTNATSTSESDGLMLVRIRELEEQLHAAHAHIHHLEAQNALNALRALENSSISSSFTIGVKGGESVSKEKNGRDPLTTPTLTISNNNNNDINVPTTATTIITTGAKISDKRGEATFNNNSNRRNSRAGDVMLQKQLSEALQQAEVHRSALAATEERLNQEIHAHHASQEKQQLLQAELTSVWKRLENTEHQLKLLLEERDDDISFGGENYSSDMVIAAGLGSSLGGSIKGMAAMQRELQQARLREMEQQKELERLQIELGTLQRRYKEQQQQQKQVRAARAEMLRRLEKTFTESLRRQECELEAIPNALQRARSEIERISVQRR
ncbi:hypothetical protein LSM04_003194 [Trypanosoma melophagium]|uniref:uncharacterized protein n=1 Tax=Trypanosoma melophagium TaxID=715481 RepID=UPI00351A5AC8|nr:hypothetical protein LSM04_003194 [Trypanosoma melophagium]